MNARAAGLLLFVVLTVTGTGIRAAPAPVGAAAAAFAKSGDEDKDGCERNLKLLYQAIQAYRADHQDIPNWLSDLVPRYVSDPNLLICPACRKTGQSETGKLADPRLPCSYLFEFCPVPLTAEEAPGGAGKTRRDWKRRQMDLAGAAVPLVRCKHHEQVLNLAFDGRIYESPDSWQSVLGKEINPAILQAAAIFPAAKSKQIPAVAKAPKPKFLPRDPLARPGLIDLGPYYNASLTETWIPFGKKNDLSALPTGVQKFGEVEYDVRGLLHLAGSYTPAKRFPVQITGIKINQKCSRLHFLHATDWGGNANEGEQVGSYLVHYATNNSQLEVPIVYGHDLRNWHFFNSENTATDQPVAWISTNLADPASPQRVRLFTTTWINVIPEARIDTIDFISAMHKPAPFLVAITAD